MAGALLVLASLMAFALLLLTTRPLWAPLNDDADAGLEEVGVEGEGGEPEIEVER